MTLYRNEIAHNERDEHRTEQTRLTETERALTAGEREYLTKDDYL